MSSSIFSAGSIGDSDEFEPIEPECPSCGDLLTLHQPEADQPDELLGVCRECNGWHLIVPGVAGGVELVIKIMKAELIASARAATQVSKKHSA